MTDRLTDASDIDLLIVCWNRPSELASAVAAARACGFENVFVLDNGSEPRLEPIEGTVHLRSEENLGPAAGRNLLAGSSRSPCLLFVDDDAVLLPPTSPERVVESLRANRGRGAVVGLITRPGGQVLSMEFPFRSLRDIGTPRQCAYVLEGLLAVDRQAWEAVGGYEGAFFYSNEGVDLALRMIRGGWEIWYDPGLRLEHRPSSVGRLRGPQLAQVRLQKRCLYARRHLPWALAIIHLSVWAAHTAVASRGRDPGGIVRALRSGFEGNVERDALSYRDCLALHRLGARILW